MWRLRRRKPASIVAGSPAAAPRGRDLRSRGRRCDRGSRRAARAGGGREDCFRLTVGDIMSDTIDKLPNASVRFARAATRHRVSKDRIRHVIANYRVRFEEPPPAGREGVPDTRLVFLGEDPQGEPLEVMAIQLPNGGLLLIHAMLLRNKYRQRYEEAKQ
jgi:hypothetical protein